MREDELKTSMREIKFRAWDTLKKRWCDRDGKDWFILTPDGEINFPEGGWDINGSITSPEEQYIILEQYTGLKDKNGKEIWEGDIVKGHTNWADDNGNVEVDDEWQTSEVKCVLDEFEGYKFSAAFLNLDAVEVIGNIHENPELLQ